MTHQPTSTFPVTRRHVLAATVATGVALAARTGRSESSPLRARGSVFEDADGSGRRGPVSTGIPGVMVSNGHDVVLTDADGHWELPVEDGDSLFVIKPPGWSTPTDPVTRLPRYAQTYAPDGTQGGQDFRFAGVAPTGKLPDSVDFPLRRHEEKPRFEAILFTDPQPESLAEVGYVRDAVVAQTAGVTAAFGITHGDVMFDDLAYYDRYNRIVGTVGVPWYNLPGNHDMNFEAPDNRTSRETFKRVFGARRAAFQCSGATFILLDNVDYLGTDPAKPDGAGKYRGFFGPAQLEFVRNVLAHVPTDSLVVYSFHIPLRTVVGDEPNNATVDWKDFLAAIATHPNSVSFCGHTHTNEHHYFDATDGFAVQGAPDAVHHHHILAAVSGSWWSGPFDERGIPIALGSDGTPNGFHILSIDGPKYATRLVPARDPLHAQVRIMLESQLHGSRAEVLTDYEPGTLLTGPIARDAVASARLVVNLYDGGPRSKVEVSFSQGSGFMPMRPVPRTDPFVEEVYTRNVATKKPWVQPTKSRHIWQASLPADLTPGTHRVTVRATDEYGKPHVAWMILEVTSA